MTDDRLRSEVGIMIEYHDMSWFVDPEQEDSFCKVLRAYIEEWGPENLRLLVPTDWRMYGPRTIGGVGVIYSTTNSIAIQVVYGFVRLKYEAHVRWRPAA